MLYDANSESSSARSTIAPQSSHITLEAWQAHFGLGVEELRLEKKLGQTFDEMSLVHSK